MDKKAILINLVKHIINSFLILPKDKQNWIDSLKRMDEKALAELLDIFIKEKNDIKELLINKFQDMEYAKKINFDFKNFKRKERIKLIKNKEAKDLMTK